MEDTVPRVYDSCLATVVGFDDSCKGCFDCKFDEYGSGWHWLPPGTGSGDSERRLRLRYPSESIVLESLPLLSEVQRLQGQLRRYL